MFGVKSPGLFEKGVANQPPIMFTLEPQGTTHPASLSERSLATLSLIVPSLASQNRIFIKIELNTFSGKCSTVTHTRY